MTVAILCLVLALVATARVRTESGTPSLLVPTGVMREFWFSISWFDGSPAGFPRRLLGVNGQSPGPAIRGNYGDIVRVHVMNNIQTRDNTSIHWHGLHQRGTPWADGVEQVTQCPIIYGATYTYEFQLLNSGTHWYHAHHGVQLVDGLWGVVIVDPAKEVWGHLYEEELIISLSDHFLATGEELMKWFYSPGHLDLIMAAAQSTLINGNGTYPCEYAALQNLPCTQKPRAPTVIEVLEGVPYRLRVICATSARAYLFSIDNHTMEAIEVDGIDTQRSGQFDTVHLSSGMRYSLVVNMTAGGAGDEFYIRALNSRASPRPTSQDINPYPNARLNPGLAILRYVAHPTRPRQIQNQEHNIAEKPKAAREARRLLPFDNQLCLPFGNKSRVVAPDRYDEELVVTFDRATAEHGYFTTNGLKYGVTQWQSPNLLQVLWNQTLPVHSLPIRTGGSGQVVQLVINNRHEIGHPIHLHGHSFWMVGVGMPGEGDYNASLHSHRLKTRVIFRDTVRFEHNSWLVLRYIADNPGVWMLHCHVTLHIPGGMAAVIVEGEDLLRQKFAVPAESLRICREFGISSPNPSSKTMLWSSGVLNLSTLIVIVMRNELLGV